MGQKIQIYLDTNIAERYFKRAVEAMKQHKEIIVPKIFIYFLSRKDLELFISSFTLAEISEHLWKKDMEPKDISKLISSFLVKFDIFQIFDFSIKGEILRWIRKFKLEAKDVIHLSIARNNNFYLLTDDFYLSSRGKGIYDKIITEKELRFIFPKRLS